MNKIEDLIKEAVDGDAAFYAEAFRGYVVPEDIKCCAIRLTRSYGIRGICDPMYFANIIALELGRGDGQGSFTERG